MQLHNKLNSTKNIENFQSLKTASNHTNTELLSFLKQPNNVTILWLVNCINFYCKLCYNSLIISSFASLSLV